MSALERSPNTVRAYAVSLRLWFEFLGQAGVGWAEAGAEDVARFVAWLPVPAESVIVLETGAGRR
jgi:integrase/recombinase XerD